MADMRRVGVFITNTFSAGLGALTGIRAFCQTHTQWNLAVVSGDEKVMFGHLAGALDGIIAWPRSQEFALALEAWGKPRVSVIGNVNRNSIFPGVVSDNLAVGRAGAEHLLGLGFKRLAFLGFQDYNFAQARKRVFLDVVQSSGGSSFVHEIPASVMFDWPSMWKGIASWVSSLPKPIGVMAANDALALELLNACKGLGIRVPAQVAVLGVGNETLSCLQANPSLSSVDPGLARIGFRAASFLEELMSGGSVPPGMIKLPPTEVVGRASTDTLSLTDPHVAKALRYIWAHACDPMQVNDLLKVVPLSRRTLELRFFQVLGRSLHEEIRRVQLQRATRLLGQPQLSMDKVARASGFSSAGGMIRVFRKNMGITPGEHRRRLGPMPATNPEPGNPAPTPSSTPASPILNDAPLF